MDIWCEVVRGSFEIDFCTELKLYSYWVVAAI